MREGRKIEALPPLVGGILIGGASRRMGSAKALLEWRGESFVERIAGALATVVTQVVLLGPGTGMPPNVARLPVVEDAARGRGPLSGLMAAFDHRPEAAWLIATCDQPLLSSATLEWLIGERRHDRIAVLPLLTPGRLEPFPGIYEPGCAAALAALAGPGGSASLQPLSAVAGVHLAPVPAGLAAELRGVNTPEELAALRLEAAPAAKDRDRDG